MNENSQQNDIQSETFQKDSIADATSTQSSEKVVNKSEKKENPFISLIFNILIPTIILIKFSDEDS